MAQLLTIEEIRALESDQTYRRAEPCNLSKKAILSFASELSEHMLVTPSTVQEAILLNGGRVQYVDLSDYRRLDESIFIDSLNNFTIFMGLHTNPIRNRFTLAHEFGHYILHYLVKYGIDEQAPKIRAARIGNDLVEQEANWFALGFLLPTTEFVKKAEKFNRNADYLASHFRVSKRVVELRLEEIENAQ